MGVNAQGEPVARWQPGDVVPDGYRIRYTVSPSWVIGGAATLGLSYTVTTLITGGIASTGFAVVFAPIGGIPLVGGYAMSGIGALVGAGPGTIASLIALSTVQIIGFSVMLKGLKDRKPAALVPTCEDPVLSFSPMVAPGVAGMTMGGAL